MSKTEVLNKFFGYSSFREGQEEIIDYILEGHHVLAVLPTGGGKSLCYQIPALLSGSFAIIVSPLIALMKNQVDAINNIDNKAALINSTISQEESETVYRNIYAGKIRLLYVSPEKLANKDFTERIKFLNPEYLFVDEAHCISEWGLNFRPSYRKIKSFIEITGIRKIAAFTATSTPEVVKDIISQLELKDVKFILKGFERNNLFINIIKTNNKRNSLLEILGGVKFPGIIYTSTRKNAEAVSSYLNQYNIKSKFFHAGIPNPIKNKIQNEFFNGEIDIIVATNAFGMGIDKNNIRFIIHYNMPSSIENYYQEIGRAGRDGADSHTYLLYKDEDLRTQKFLIKNSSPNPEIIKRLYDSLCDSANLAFGNKMIKPVKLSEEYIIKYFNNRISSQIIQNGLKILEEGGYINILSDYNKNTRLKIIVDPTIFKEYLKSLSDEELKNLFLLLLRKFGGELFIRNISINISDLASQLSTYESRIISMFYFIETIGFIEFDKKQSGDYFLINGSRIDTKYLMIDLNKIKEYQYFALRKLDKMYSYVFYNDCRFKYILQYFNSDEKIEYKYGKCDNCNDVNLIAQDLNDYFNEILIKACNELDSPATEEKLIDILLGTTNNPALSKITLFGTCSNFSKLELKELISNSIQNKILFKSGNNLQLNPRYIIKSNANDESPIEIETDLELFNLLTELRSNSAKKYLQNPQIICSDEILRRVTEIKPRKPSELLSINSFNKRMFNKIGLEILEVVNSFIDKIEDGIKNENISSTLVETFELVKKKYSLEDISKLRKLSETIISLQIEKIIEYDPKTDISSLVSKNEIDEIKKLYADNLRGLKEIKKMSSINLSYSKIRVILAKIRTN